MGRHAATWLAVAGISLLTPVLFNMAADSQLGQKVPGLQVLNSYTTRRNG